jgi:ABC-type lipoprotein export system ATPase subunit
MQYRLQIAAHTETHFPNANLDCGRISVIIGSNGSGKTHFLNYLIHTLTTEGKQNNYLKIESNRVVSDELNQANIGKHYNEYGSPEKAEIHYKGKRGGLLSQRIRYSLLLLKQRSSKEEKDYLLSIRDWANNGRAGNCPEEDESSLEKIFRLFRTVFPHISISQDINEQFLLEQRGRVYNIIQASEGERQVFALITDVILNSDPNFIIIVDEPEAHLNPLLANQVWDAIEGYLPHAQFIYATHSISFAMRQQVDSLFAIDKVQNELLPIKGIEYLSHSEQADLLGAVPAILTAKQVLCVEGGDTSFDFPFYGWILGDSEIKIIPLGNCKDVRASTDKLLLWKELAPSCIMVGVIDSDYKDIVSEQSSSLYTLKLHEAESYLCFPNLLHKLASNTFDSILSEAELSAIIIDYANQQLLKTTLNNVASIMTIPRTHINTKNCAFSSLDTLKNSIPKFISSKLKDLDEVINKSDNIIQEEYNRCCAAIKSEDIVAILKLFAGKELLNKLATRIGYASSAKLLDSAIKFLNPNDFTELSNLRNELKTRLTKCSV